MDYHVEERDNCIIIKLKDNLKDPDAAEFNDKLYELIDNGFKDIVADVSDVKSINVSGFGLLINGLITVRNAGGDLRLAGTAKQVNNFLSSTKLQKVFNHYQTVEEAVVSYREKYDRKHQYVQQEMPRKLDKPSKRILSVAATLGITLLGLSTVVYSLSKVDLELFLKID